MSGIPAFFRPSSPKKDSKKHAFGNYLYNVFYGNGIGFLVRYSSNVVNFPRAI